MQVKVMEHLDRLLTYVDVRDKAIALSQMQTGALSVDQVESQWPTEYDETSGHSWQWVDDPVGRPQRSDPEEEEADINKRCLQKCNAYKRNWHRQRPS